MHQVMKKFRGVVVTMFAVLMLGTGSLRGQEAPAAPAVDAQADAVLHAMSDYYKKLDSLSLDGTSHISRTVDNQKQQMQTRFRFAMRRPNHFAMTPIGADADQWSTVLSDGEHLTIYVGKLNRYTVDESPKDLDALMSNRLVGLLSSHVGRVVGALMTSDPYAKLTADLTRGEYLGKSERDGVAAHHLRMHTAQSSWDTWIAAGDAPRLLEVEPDMSPIEKRAATAGQKVQLTMRIVLSEQSPNASLGDDQFAFTAPAGAVKVASFSRDPAQEAGHPLAGKPAPAFTLNKLDGQAVSLADHAGKDIVVLDFWATWCGPCVQAMPIIDRVVEGFKGKHVVLYAVNLREDKARIEAFLKARKLDVTVLMDHEGKVAGAYGAHAIPQTVIIDRDGVVQAVHVGLIPDLEATLTRELDDLVAGKKLVQ